MEQLSELNRCAMDLKYHMVVKDRLVYLWKGYRAVNHGRLVRQIDQCFDTQHLDAMTEYLNHKLSQRMILNHE